MLKKLLVGIMTTIALVLLLLVIVVLLMFIRYDGVKILDEKANTAVSGILFNTNIIELKHYKKIGHGDTWLLGSYTSYTRSDKHQSISVYHEETENYIKVKKFISKFK